MIGPRPLAWRAIGRFLPLAAALASPSAAASAELACRMEGAVLLVPARVAGVAGEYILDAGAPRTLLHDTRAQGAGLDVVALRAPVRVGGVDLGEAAIAVVDLDARTRRLPIPAAGVIGSDVLSRRTVDIRFSPCRVAFLPPAGRAAARGRRLPMRLIDGAPAVEAAVSDGATSRRGWFRVDTGSPLAVSLSADGAVALDEASRPVAPETTSPDAVRPRLGQLRALSVGAMLIENPPAGLAQVQAGLAGALGAPVWMTAGRLRLDYAHGDLMLGPP